MAWLAAVKTLASEQNHFDDSFTRDHANILHLAARWEIDSLSAVTAAELCAIAAAL